MHFCSTPNGHGTIASRSHKANAFRMSATVIRAAGRYTCLFTYMRHVVEGPVRIPNIIPRSTDPLNATIMELNALHDMFQSSKNSCPSKCDADIQRKKRAAAAKPMNICVLFPHNGPDCTHVSHTECTHPEYVWVRWSLFVSTESKSFGWFRPS